ncbi:Capsule polysaccharide biosynthesis protein [uncultured archaeon]|nr:Capsule polysaccharide biosynthesis protein [uncultured archaeon]
MAKPRILIQLEGYFNVGVARYLQDNLDCDIYALVDINKQIKKFFLQQQFVNFKKVWYLRDHLMKLNTEPNLEYLASFEKKYKINLWLIAHMDRILLPYNYFRCYHRYSREEILQIAERLCKLYEDMFDEVNPDFIILRTTDNFQGELLLQLSHARKVTVLMPSHSRLGRRCMISSNVDIIDNFDELFKSSNDASLKTFEELHNLLQEYKKQVYDLLVNHGVNTAYQKLKAGLYYLFKVCNNEYRQYYANFGRTRTKILIQETKLVIKKIIREYFVNKNLKRDFDKNSKFVYYPLHLNPERSTLHAAPFYVNQLEVITNIAKSLPVEYKLYVKEHPSQLFAEWRSISYYKYLMNLPNVELLHPAVSNDELLKYCSLVITTAGTAGLEAAYYNKPSIVLADTIYSSVLPSVYRLRSYEDLPNAIRTSLEKKVEISDLTRYTKCVFDNTFEYDIVGIDTFQVRRIPNSFYIPDVEMPYDEIINMINDMKDVWTKVGEAFVQKICGKSK